MADAMSQIKLNESQANKNEAEANKKTFYFSGVSPPKEIRRLFFLVKYVR